MQEKRNYSMPAYTEVSPEWIITEGTIPTRAQYLTGRPKHFVVSPGERHVVKAESQFVLLFTSDVPYIAGNEEERRTYSSAHIHLVPLGVLLVLEAIDSPVECFTMDFRAHSNLCQGGCPPPSQRARYGKVGRPRKEQPLETVLPYSEGVYQWVSTVRHYLPHTQVSVHTFDFKLQEFFLLLELDYHSSDKKEFLQYYHCRITGFRSCVVQSYTPSMEVVDLYKLSERFGLNELAFKRSFIEEFGISPREWITQQRARHIYRELVSTNRSLREIGADYGFCSMSYFSLFCKANLGGTPMQIRRGDLNSDSDEE